MVRPRTITRDSAVPALPSVPIPRLAVFVAGLGGNRFGGQALELAGEVALLGCTVSPGFDYADYRSGTYAELAEKWPPEKERIRVRTRNHGGE